ncbi:hypothetical protein FGB62_83g08 [Gracilaria domingensis]|nr:hypothetical protein FGB62_83g08 [Gracilaria domingensis]
MVGFSAGFKALKTSAKVGKAALKGDKEELSRVTKQEMHSWRRYAQRKQVQTTASQLQEGEQYQQETDAQQNDAPVEQYGAGYSDANSFAQDNAVSYDTNNDGVDDYVQFDSNGDGVLDSFAQDMDGDGIIDTVGSLFSAFLG